MSKIKRFIAGLGNCACSFSTIIIISTLNNLRQIEIITPPELL